jgi:TolA-binding protein
MRRLTAIVRSLPLLALAACTSSEDMTLLHREITDVQQQVEQLSQSMPAKQDLASLDSRMQEVAAQTSRSNADLAVRVEQLQEQIEGLQASLERTTRQLETISQELARARSSAATGQYLPPVTAAGTPADVASGTAPGPAAAAGASAGAAADAAAGATEGSSPEELYRAAYEDYMRGNYQLAADGFGEYRRRGLDGAFGQRALLDQQSVSTPRTRPRRRSRSSPRFSRSTRRATRPRPPSSRRVCSTSSSATRDRAFSTCSTWSTSTPAPARPISPGSVYARWG